MSIHGERLSIEMFWEEGHNSQLQIHIIHCDYSQVRQVKSDAGRRYTWRQQGVDTACMQRSTTDASLAQNS